MRVPEWVLALVLQVSGATSLKLYVLVDRFTFLVIRGVDYLA
jgi:hypothetical protein